MNKQAEREAFFDFYQQNKEPEEEKEQNKDCKHHHNETYDCRDYCYFEDVCKNHEKWEIKEK